MAPPPPGAMGPGPATASGGGWYNGPIPIESLAPRETFGAAIGKTLVKALTVLVVLLGGLFLIPIFFIALGAAIGGGGSPDSISTPRELVAGERSADIRLAAIPITGVILGEDRGGGGGGGLFGALDVTYGYTIKEELADLAENDSIDGVILELDSPGGTIFGSQAIADGVAEYQEATGKPVIAYVGGISASGGVYAMAGADVIYADHGTLVGSIGVIFGPFERYDGVTAIDGGLLGGGITTEGGIEVEFLTAGRAKDLGNPYRPMTDEERAVLQEGLDNAYADFVTHVSEGRGLSDGEIVDGLGALIFGEHQALANGLIDGIANRDAAYELAAEAAGLEDDETWGVERLQAPSTGLLDLLASPLDGGLPGLDDGGTGDDGGVATAGGVAGGLGSSHPLCLGTGTILAYHGDPLRLCQPGR
ncbi:MAG: S49 family peptidase [Actinomycetota bacterium]